MKTTKINLGKIPTLPPSETDRKAIEAQTEGYKKKISALQKMLYAQKKHSVLIVFQGLDASGKDGAVNAALEGCSPIGLKVTGFGKPTDAELAHDFLWRIYPHLPAKGEMSVFIRSHYEDVLIQRVHNWINLDQVHSRFDAINAFEQNIVNDKGTTIIKFYLHISEEGQEAQLMQRINDPEKQWKHNTNDWAERKHWAQYQKAYTDVLNTCNKAAAWHVIPTDKRWYRNYLVAKTVCETLESLNLSYPIRSAEELATV